MDNISEILTRLELIPVADCAPGSLALTSTEETSAAGVLQALRDFGGSGWLCAADIKTIRRFSSEKPLPELDAGAWPLAAEAVNGQRSLHVSRAGDNWQLTTVTRVAAETDTESVLLQVTLTARDQQGDLRYEVAWRPTDVAGLRELRPCAYRFCGFSH